MKKSVFVIDTPEHGCISCVIGKYMFDPHITKIYCPIAGRTAFDQTATAEERPEWCPLKLLPEKISMEKTEEYYYGKMHGWNACIDKIVGGDNGKHM